MYPTMEFVFVAMHKYRNLLTVHQLVIGSGFRDLTAIKLNVIT